MRVKVHPHKTFVNAGIEACVSITPIRKYGRAYYMGTVALYDVDFVIHESGVLRAQAAQQRNVHAWAVGELIDEYPTQHDVPEGILRRRKMLKVTYHYNVGRFMTVAEDPNDVIDVTDGHFDIAWFCGRNFYISEF